MAAAILASATQDHCYPSRLLGMTLAGQIRYFLLGFLLADVYLMEWRNSPGEEPLVGPCGPGSLGGGGNPADPGGDASVVLGKVGDLLRHARRTAGGVHGRVPRPVDKPLLHESLDRRHRRHVLHDLPLPRAAGQHDPAPLFGFDPTPGYTVANILKYAVTVAGILAVSAVLFVLLEKPFMRKDWPARLAAALRNSALRIPGVAFKKNL